MSKNHWYLFTLLALLFFFTSSAQDSVKQEYFRLTKTLPLRDVAGSISGSDINLRDTTLYLVFTESNTIVVINFMSGKTVAIISGVLKPRKVSYIADKDELFITTETSKCFFYSSKNYKQLAKINIMSPSNPVIYEENSKKIYLGYEEGIKVVDINSHKIEGFLPLYY